MGRIEAPLDQEAPKAAVASGPAARNREPRQYTTLLLTDSGTDPDHRRWLLAGIPKQASESSRCGREVMFGSSEFPPPLREARAGRRIGWPSMTETQISPRSRVSIPQWKSPELGVLCISSVCAPFEVNGDIQLVETCSRPRSGGNGRCV
jgi:hypothetical protein